MTTRTITKNLPICSLGLKSNMNSSEHFNNTLCKHRIVKIKWIQCSVHTFTETMYSTTLQKNKEREKKRNKIIIKERTKMKLVVSFVDSFIFQLLQTLNAQMMFMCVRNEWQWIRMLDANMHDYFGDYLLVLYSVDGWQFLRFFFWFNQTAKPRMQIKFECDILCFNPTDEWLLKENWYKFSEENTYTSIKVVLFRFYWKIKQNEFNAQRTNKVEVNRMSTIRIL